MGIGRIYPWSLGLWLLLLGCQPDSREHIPSDSPDERAAAADRYLEAISPKDMMTDLAANMAASMPEPSRQQFVDLMTRHLDLDAFRRILRDALVKHLLRPA